MSSLLAGELDNPSDSLFNGENAVAVSLKWKIDKDWNFSFESVSIGFLQKHKIGNDMANVEVEMGTKVTYKPGEEKKNPTLKELAPNVAEPEAVRGGGETHKVVVTGDASGQQVEMHSTPKPWLSTLQITVFELKH